MAKKEFEWDHEQLVGAIQFTDKKRFVVSSCELVEKEYVSIRVEQFFKKKGESAEAWHITKNHTLPYEVWKECAEVYEAWRNELIEEDE